MVLRRHIPAPPLARYVDFFWYYEDWDGAHSMEQVLPDGAFELVINLLDGPRKLFDRDDLTSHSSFRRGWLSGAHSRYIVIDTLSGASMIGAHFKPGGAAPFLGIPALEFQDQVIEFEAVWSKSAADLRERILAVPGIRRKFHHLEQFLLRLLSRARIDAHRQEKIDWAAGQFDRKPDVMTIATAAEALGLSHKHFIAQFHERVGLTPKLFCRIRRFQRLLRVINARQRIDWADLACACGYYDQSHLVKDFQAFAGLNPSAYRSLSEDYASFVPIGESR